MEIMCKSRILADTNLFVLDMDGTFYLEDTILDGSLFFLEQLRRMGKDFLFFTNNSSKAPEDYIEKLGSMDCKIEAGQIMTSGDVMIAYLNTYYQGKRVKLLGTPALERSFISSGIMLADDVPEVVVVGFDTTLTYKKLEEACDFIREGAVFLATHPDLNCPTRRGFIPDCGAICQAITASVGVKPQFVGKPYRETVDMVIKRTGRKLEELAFVGDRLYTDVAVGVNHGAKGFLVLTGETKAADLAQAAVKPHAVFESLKEMGMILEKLHSGCLVPVR